MRKVTILVVDDEPDVLRFVSGLLERAGYEIVTAPGPLQALEIIAIRGALDLVVTDVIMPEMCGPELADRIRLLSPSTTIMFMSGCVPSGQLPKGVPFIGKPFLPADLLRAVEKALRKSSQQL